MIRTTTSLPHSTLPVAHPWDGSTGVWDATRFPITKVVLHTMVGTVTGAAAVFANPESKRSANYGVGLDGQIYQWVGEDQTAYHAGNYIVNQSSIGIEHEDNRDYNGVRTDALYKASAQLVRDICLFYGIPIDREHIVRHNEVPDPKNPGHTVQTGCPDALDIDKIVLLAQQNISAAPSELMSDDEKNTLSFLKSLEIRASFGNLEGMARSLVASYIDYKKILQPDGQGKTPIVIPAEQFVDLTIKGKNLDKIADYFGYPEPSRIENDFGAKIVDTIKVISKPEANPAVSPVVPPSGASPTVPFFGNTTQTPPSNDNMTFSVSGKANLIGSLFGALGKAYSSLFLEGTK